MTMYVKMCTSCTNKYIYIISKFFFCSTLIGLIPKFNCVSDILTKLLKFTYFPAFTSMTIT